VNSSPDSVVALRQQLTEQGVFVAVVLLASTANGGFAAPQVLAVFDLLLGHPTLTLEDRPAVVQAAAGLRAGLDFADALHHASCRNCQTIASFDDRGFARRIRQLNLPPRVVVPG